LGSDRRAWGRERAREIGRRNPRLMSVIGCILVAGVIATCGYQLSHGTYLGRGWVIAALAGIAAAAGVSAAALISIRRHGSDRAFIAWLVLTLVSASAIRFPFPAGPYGSVQALVNVVHAALLGSEAVTAGGIVSLLAYFLVRSRSLPSRAVVQQPPVRSATSRAEYARDYGLPARLRFPWAEAATWRAGRLIATNGRVTWVSRKGDVEVDLTAACQALLVLPTNGRQRQPRTTTLATADGLAEVDVSPRALETVAGSLRRPPYGDTTHPGAQD